MVLRIFGAGQGGIRYLFDNPTAYEVEGNVELARALLQALPDGCGQRFLSGVLNENTPLSEAVAWKARREFEEQLRAGLPRTSLHILWVNHGDKGRFEQHFVAVAIEILTGKHVAWYIDRIDRQRYEKWVESFNIRLNLEHAFDKLKIRPDFTRLRLSATDREYLTFIWETVDEAVKAGIVTNRPTLVSHLRYYGHEVRAHTAAGKPLQQLVITHPSGKTHRLRGSIYYRLDFGSELQEKVRVRSQQSPAERLRELSRAIDKGLDFRAFHWIGRLFGRREQRTVGRGQARHRLSDLMKPANQKLRAKKAPMRAFSVKMALEALFLRRKIAELQKTDHAVDVDAIRDPKQRTSVLLEHWAKLNKLRMPNAFVRTKRGQTSKDVPDQSGSSKTKRQPSQPPPKLPETDLEMS